MSVMSSQITGISIVCSTVCSGADQRKHQSSASLAFVREIQRWPVHSLHNWPVTRKTFPFDDIIMWYYENMDDSWQSVACLLQTNKRPVGLYSSAAYWNHDDQGKGSSSELDMLEYIMFGLDWVCLTTTRPSGHISRRINNVWPMLRQWSFSWSFQDVCLAVLYVRKG